MVEPAPAAQELLGRRTRPGILYLIDQLDYSGAELMHLPVLRADADPLLACPPGSRTEELAHELGIATVPLRFRSLRHSSGALETIRSLGRGIGAALDLRRLLRAHPDRQLLYATTVRPGMVASLAKLGLGRRAVWFVATWMPPAPLRGLVRLLAGFGCDLAVATSKAIAEDFRGRSRRLARRTVTLYPSTDISRFEPGRARPGTPRAAIVGQVSHTKRTDLALDITERLLPAHPRFELEVIGRAQYRADDFRFERMLHERVRADERLSQRVRFTGYAADVPGALARAGLLLHCCPDEPFGIALVEAMALGLPVVAPAEAGPVEIVEEGVTGLLYPPGDAETAARLVAELLEDPDRAARMGRAGRQAAVRRFSSERYVAAVEALLGELAAAS